MKRFIKVKLGLDQKLAGFSFLLLVGLLGACGEQPSPAIRPSTPQKTCVIVEQRLPSSSKVILSADYESSPLYCQHVVDDYKGAMAWYQNELKNNTYTASFLNGLSNYYTGQLLLDTQKGIFYNQQSGRVVIGRWSKENEQISGPTWDKAGLNASLSIKIKGYQMLSFKEGSPLDPSITPGAEQENWIINLIYDEKAGHWKIVQACNVLNLGSQGCTHL